MIEGLIFTMGVMSPVILCVAVGCVIGTMIGMFCDK